MMSSNLTFQLFFNGQFVDRTTIECLESAQVRTNSDGPAGFQMTFQIINKSPVHDRFLFSSGSNVRSESRVAMKIVLTGTPHYLIDGIITNHQLTPSSRPGATSLTLTGEDLTRVMDYEERDGLAFRNQSLGTRVRRILSSYATHGITAKVIDEKYRDAGTATTAVPHQRGTDLQYIRTLANSAGHVFFLEPTGINRSVAYWGPEYQADRLLPALTVDMGVATNVEALNFTFNSEQREDPVVVSQQEDNRQLKPVAITNKFEVNKTVKSPGQPPDKRKTKLREVAKFSDARARLEGLAAATRSNNSVTAQGTLDTLRYGAILQVRQKIEVRGATRAFNGTWIIRSVTHRLARGEYKQDFQLVRNSLDTTQSFVKVRP